MSEVLEDLLRWQKQIADYVYRNAPIKAIYTTHHAIPGGWMYLYRTDGWREFYVNRVLLMDSVQHFGGADVLSFEDQVSGTNRLTAIPVIALD